MLISDSRILTKLYSNYFSKSIHLSKGEYLYREGEICDSIIFIEDGRINLYKDVNNKNILLWLTVAPEIIGLTSFLNNYSTFNLSAIVAKDSIVKSIKPKHFLEILQKNGDFKYAIMSDLSKRINTMHFHTQIYIKGSSKQKILNTLTNQNFNRGLFNKKSYGLTIDEISDINGLMLKNTKSILKNLANKGIISLDKDVIKIIDFNKLNVEITYR